MAAVISVASAKGGCGKTTLAILAASELALMGYNVHILDADINQHGLHFSNRQAELGTSIAGLTITGGITEANLLASMRAAEANGADAIIVDLPGGTSVLSLMSMQRSNLVLIPSRVSTLDARDANRTISQVDNAQELVRTPIPRTLVWTGVPAGFETRAAKHVREEVEGQGVPCLPAALIERVAYREMHITGEVPRQRDANSPAAENVAAVTRAILAILAPQTETV